MKLNRISPATRNFLQEARTAPDFRLSDLIHGYVYGRWTYLYIALGKGDHPISRFYRRIKARFHTLRNPSIRTLPVNPARATHADGYHGKVMPLDKARQLVTVNEDIVLRDLEKIIPYPRARDIILKYPDHIIALQCPCRTAKPSHCTPVEVCLVVGEPFATFVHEHHPSKSRWISQAEAIGILEAENRRGHVSHAFFKDAMLGRFYAICNCCSCCCGAIQAHRNGNPMLASSGYLAQVDPDLCQVCGECLEICQFDALDLGYDHVEIDQEACMGCGVCAEHCLQGALALYPAPERGVPLEIEALMNQVS